MAVNPAIAHRLLLLLAEMGHAESQADVAFHLALGVEPVAPNSKDQLFRRAGAGGVWVLACVAIVGVKWAGRQPLGRLGAWAREGPQAAAARS